MTGHTRECTVLNMQVAKRYGYCECCNAECVQTWDVGLGGAHGSLWACAACLDGFDEDPEGTVADACADRDGVSP